MHVIRLLALLFALTASLLAQMSWTSSQVVDFVRKSAKSSADKDLADYLKKVTLTDRLTDEAFDNCVKAGAGPRARVALIALIEQSSGLPAPPKPAPAPVPGLSVSKPTAGPPPPSEEVQAQVLEKVTEYARNYIKGLPNFTCAQVTKRYFDPSNTAEAYKLQDTVLERLSYLDGEESYKVISVNNTPTTKGHWELGGTTSAGEFGTDMKVLFSPQTNTEFKWNRWITWHGRRTHEFAYQVRQENSSWTIEYEKTQHTVPGYKGFIYVDRELNMIMRITRESEGIPADFPIQNVKQITTYDFKKIGDSEQEFLVPVGSSITSKNGRAMVKNETAFRLYNKYGATATLKFGDIEETPEPVKPPIKNQD